ncbi:MAG TPA: hypothetical protein VGR89_03170 [Puia sp.]|nr:hypothetical protein [Puia sp.]
MGLLTFIQRRAIRKLKKRGEWGASMAREAMAGLEIDFDQIVSIAQGLERALSEHERAEDAKLLNDPDLKESLEQMRRGEYTVLHPKPEKPLD